MTKYVMIVLWVLLIGVFSVARSEPTLEETKEWTRKYRISQQDICVYVNELSKTGREDDTKAALWFLIKGGPDGFRKTQATASERALLLEAMDNSCKVYYESGTTNPISEWSVLPTFGPIGYESQTSVAHSHLLHERLEGFLRQGAKMKLSPAAEDLGVHTPDTASFDEFKKKLDEVVASNFDADKISFYNMDHETLRFVAASIDFAQQRVAGINAVLKEAVKVGLEATKESADMVDAANREREGRLRAEHSLQFFERRITQFTDDIVTRLCGAYPYEIVKRIMKIIHPSIRLD